MNVTKILLLLNLKWVRKFQTGQSYEEREGGV